MPDLYPTEFVKNTDPRVHGPVMKDWVWMEGGHFTDSSDGDAIEFSGLCYQYASVKSVNGILGSGYDSTHGNYTDIRTQPSVTEPQIGNPIITPYYLTINDSGKEKRKNFPRFLIKFAYPQTTNFRSFLGFHSGYISPYSDPGTFPAGDDSLNGKSGIGLYITSGGNFRIGYNDGSGATNFTSSLATIDTNVHTIYIEADDDNARWGYSFDNTPITYLTTNIPAQTSPLNTFYHIETTENVSKHFRLFDLKYARRFGLNYG